jgi:phosphopantetheine adenylyltransferase
MMLAKKSVLIGLTSDQMIEKKSSQEYIQPYSLRYKTILDFVSKMNYNNIEINVYVRYLD